MFTRFTRYKALTATLAVTAALIATCFIAAPSQAAITWQNLGTSEDHQDFDDCTGAAGHIQMKVQWEFSSDFKLRLDKDYDIKVVNNSDARIVINPAVPAMFDPGSLTYQRLRQNNVISGYHHGSTNLYLAPHATSTLSADAADRWYRMDGVTDSDASPYNTHISDGSDPAIALNAFIQIYTQGAWHYCGTGLVINLEIKNNAA